MKLEKAMSCLWGTILSFVIGFAGICCLVTGMDMAVDIGALAGICAVAALVCSISYTLPLGAVPPAGLVLLGIYYWRQGELVPGLESLLFRLSRQYDMAYGWGVIRWSVRTTDDMEATLLMGAAILAVLVILTVAWVVCRRKPGSPGVLVGILPLLACLVVTDTVPDLIWLFLLLAGIVILLLSSTARRQDEKQGNRVCVLVTLPVTVLLLTLFAVCPQSSYSDQNAKAWMDALRKNALVDRLMGQFFEEGTSGSSVDASVVRLDTVGFRVSSSAEILRISADFDGSVYLRGRALDSYDGKSWTDSGTDVSALYWPDESLMESRGELMITTRYAHRMLYLPYYTQSKVLQGVSRSLENEKKLKMYSLACSDVPLSAYVERYPNLTDAPGWDIDPEDHIHLTDSVKKWAQPLAKQIIGDIKNPYYQARMIGAYVQNSASYDLRTGRMPGSAKDFAKWFLERSDTGYCVHFATTATVLLQAAGIPARYVTGYATEATNAHVTVVRSSDAHAWVEYWLPGYGWAVLEVTPAADGSENGDQTQGSDGIEPSLPVQPDQIQGTDATQPSGVQTPDNLQSGGQTGNKTVLRVPDGVWTALWVLLAAAGAIGLLLGQRYLRLYLRKKRLAGATANQQAIACWNMLTRMCRMLGRPPEEALFALAQKAKFSQHTITQEELSCLQQGLDEARERLRGHSVFRRFWYWAVLALY